MASEGEDEKEMTRAIRQVITNCCLEEKFDVDVLPIFDIEYFFLQLRSKSVGETVKIHVKCEKCDHAIPIDIDLSKIKTIKNKNHQEKFQLNDEF